MRDDRLFIILCVMRAVTRRESTGTALRHALYVMHKILITVTFNNNSPYNIIVLVWHSDLKSYSNELFLFQLTNDLCTSITKNVII